MNITLTTKHLVSPLAGVLSLIARRLLNYIDVTYLIDARSTPCLLRTGCMAQVASV